MLVDDIDWIYLNGKLVYLTTNGYACFNDNGKSIYIHRMVMGYTGSLQMDHINSDKLDNRKENLQILSASNNRAKTNFVPSSAGFRNVVSYKTGFRKPRAYRAHLRLKGKMFNSKRFDTPFQAAVEAQNLFEIHRPEIKVQIPFEKGWVNRCR